MNGTTPPHRHTIGITRREFLQVGYSGLLGLSMASALPAGTARAAGNAPRAKAVILVFLTGGPSHLDMWDLKPDAPAEIRGEFQPLATNVSGIRISEHLPGFAARMDRLALVRSMTHKNNGHLPATHWVLTGKAMPGLPIDSGADKIRSRTDWPSYGSALGYLRPRTDGMPSVVNLPTYLQEGALLWPGQYAGCMGGKFDPWQITDDPNKPDFKVQNLTLPSGFGVERMRARQHLLSSVNRRQDGLSRLAETQLLSEQQRDAFTLITSSRFAGAFQMEKEPAAMRERCGRHLFGQSLLLARRLVEAGVPIVQANMGHVQTWDSHENIPNRLKRDLLPPLDKGVCALLDDLRERGMAEDTLVIVVGEFGRSPKINNAGRDHWAEVFSAVFSGAGVHGGQVIGASDATGGSPATHGFSPDDLGATVYQALGLNPASEFIDREGRPQVLNTGEAIEQLYTGRGV
jgi:hypothetical protein